MEIGLHAFGELAPHPATGEISQAQRLRELVAEIVLADEVGLDVFGLGEHHRPDFAVSAPVVVLAAGAERTSRIRLSSAASVIGSDDPVRVFEAFATLDLLSGGRAEIMAGRGSTTESFALFGHDLHDYDALFEESLELLLRLRASERVSWPGGHRARIDDLGVYPRPLQDPLPVWIAVGGTPESAARAGTMGIPIALAIIGGRSERFAPVARLYRRSAKEAGHVGLPMAIASHGHVADTSQQAAEDAFPPLAMRMNRVAGERGFAPLDRATFEASLGLRGAPFVGSPQAVVDKILFQHEIFGHQRCLLEVIEGGMPHARVMRSIELLGTEVAPAVRKALAG